MQTTKQIRNKFKELFTDVEQNVGDIIELQLTCVDHRMMQLEAEGRDDDLVALASEYLEWATAENGDDYGFLFVEPIKQY